MPSPQGKTAPDPLTVNESSYRPDIDGLRAVAVLSVIAFHASARVLPGGFVGVDVFFVISGYLISQIIFNALAQSRFSLWTFYARRIRRIFPALIVVLIATWGIGYLDLSAPELKFLGKHVLAGSAFVSNFAFWQESGYFDQSASVKPLVHLWSLGVEEQFYLVWPIVLIAAWKRRSSIWKVIAFIAVASFAANILMISRGGASGAFYLPWSRFWELMIGGALAWAGAQSGNQPIHTLLGWRFTSGWPAGRVANLAAWVGAGFLLVAVVHVNERSFPGWWALLPTTGAALLIAAGKDSWLNRRILSHDWIVAIGLISYPLYLWHWPLIVFPRMDGHNHAVRISLIALSFLLAWMTYQFIEKPIRFGRSARVARFAPAGLAMTLLAVGALGAVTQIRGGFEGRFPAYINQVLSYDTTMDYNTWRVGECFLLVPSPNETRFGNDCVDANFRQTSSAQVFLWGDSVAASLYPGFAYVQKLKHFPMAQFTATNCPPFLNFDDVANRHCRGLNTYVSAQIKDLAPHTVILCAYWLKYYKSDDVDRLLGETVRFLRTSGVKEIVVVGPLPFWQPTLPRIIFLQYKRDRSYPPPLHFDTHVSVRFSHDMRGGFSDESADVETRIRARTLELGATYVSALGYLCSDVGCLSRVGDSYEAISSFDTMHLTVPAAEFLIERVFESNRFGR